MNISFPETTVTRTPKSVRPDAAISTRISSVETRSCAFRRVVELAERVAKYPSAHYGRSGRETTSQERAAILSTICTHKFVRLLEGALFLDCSVPVLSVAD